MFIKVKIVNDSEIMLNSDTITRISSFTKYHSETQEPLHGCYVELVDGTVVEVHQPFNQLEHILQANSIQKEIERLKIQNMQTRIQMQYDEIFSTIYGGVHNDQK